MKAKLFLLLIFLSVLPVKGQSVSEKLDGLLKDKVTDLSPGFVVGVVQNGEIIYKAYHGYSNLENKIKVDADTKFNIASCAKQFTALAVLKLIREKKLALEDDFRKYLPDYYPKITEPITVRDLITHTSGIRDYSDLLSVQGKPWWQRVGLDNGDVRELLAAQKDLNFSPGSGYLYSNSGYILLAELVEKVSGVSFAEYSRELFSSLEMNDTRFNTNYMAVMPNKSLPYNDWGDGNWQQYPMVVDVHGDGFLFTTLADQLRWEQLLQNRKKTGMSWLDASQEPIPGAASETYGYGVEFSTYKGYSAKWHSGGTGSYNAHFLRIPSESLSVVLMSNNGNFWSTGTAYEIVDAILDLSEEEPEGDMIIPTATSATPKKEDLAGIYMLEESGTVITVETKDNELYREIYNRDPVKLIPEKGNIFQYETFPELKMVFITNESGTYDFQLYQPGYEVRTASRLKEGTIGSTYFESLEGTYLNEELGASFTIESPEKGDITIKEGDDEYDARLIVKDLLQAGDYTLRVVEDVYGRVESILLDYSRIKNVRFERTEPAHFPKTLKTSDGGLITTATTSDSYGKGKGDILLSKSGADGNEEWFKTFGGSSYDRAGSLHLTSDGGYLLIGSTSSFGKGNYDIYVIKTDSKGKKIWEQTYGGFYNEYGYTMEELPSGYLIKGTKQECSSNTDVFNRTCEVFQWIITTDLQGNELSNEVLDLIESFSN